MNWLWLDSSSGQNTQTPRDKNKRCYSSKVLTHQTVSYNRELHVAWHSMCSDPKILLFPFLDFPIFLLDDAVFLLQKEKKKKIIPSPPPQNDVPFHFIWSQSLKSSSDRMDSKRDWWQSNETTFPHSWNQTCNMFTCDASFCVWVC